MFGKFIFDDKGSITPFMAVLLILCILLGAVNMALTIIYMDRTVIRDALDAACTSALAGATEEKWRSTAYTEYSDVVIDGDYNIEIQYKSDEDLEKSYMYIDRNKAKEIFLEILQKNLDINIKNYKINDYKIEFEYDGANIAKVVKERYEVTLNPENWWKSEFEGTDVFIKDYVSEEPWDSRPYDYKNIIFPRWVKIKAYVDVELNTPMAKLISAKDTIVIEHEAETVKELQEDKREEHERYKGE